MTSKAKAPVNVNLKNLKIKTGSCKRLLADLRVYGEEEREQRDKIQRMKDSNADPYDIKKQEEVLAETMAMIPDTKNRLNTAWNDLISIIVRYNFKENDIVNQFCQNLTFSYVNQMQKDLSASDDSVTSTTDWTDAQTMKTTLDEMFQ